MLPSMERSVRIKMKKQILFMALFLSFGLSLVAFDAVKKAEDRIVPGNTVKVVFGEEHFGREGRAWSIRDDGNIFVVFGLCDGEGVDGIDIHRDHLRKVSNLLTEGKK